jgi:hypothetical protein
MAYRSHVSSTALSSRKGKSATGRSQASTTQGRVLYVITSQDDSYATSPTMVGGVYYRPMGINSDETDISKYPFAYPSKSDIKTLPIPGEVVNLSFESDADSLTNAAAKRVYWTGIVNVWNNPHHGAIPDTTQTVWEQRLLGDFPEKKNVNALAPNPGDTIIQGRFSQTIRLTGAKGNLPFIDDSNNGEPAVLISNGQIETQDGISTVIEDINKDTNSIYLLSNHKVALTPANTKRASYNTIPVQSDQYKGNQVLINGGRLYFNAKEESILLSAKESVGLNAKTVNIDAQEYMCIDADKIYIGAKARTSPDSAKQPAVLGRQFEFWMTQLLDSLNLVANAMSNASAVGAGPVTQLNATGPVLKASIDSLKNQIKRIQSKKVYIE